MKKLAIAASAAVLLGSSVTDASAQTSTTIVVSTDAVTGKKTTRPATEAERAQVEQAMRNIASSLRQLKADAADLKSLEATLSGVTSLGSDFRGLETLQADLAPLEGLKAEIERLERMVETEIPVSTTKTRDGMVRVYRDGTIVTDKGDSRSYSRENDVTRTKGYRP